MTGSFNPLKQSEITHDMYNMTYKMTRDTFGQPLKKRVQIQALYKAE